jgi:hypothetical protein
VDASLCPRARARRCRSALSLDAAHPMKGAGREGVPGHGIVDGPRLPRRAAALVRRRPRDSGRAATRVPRSAALNLAAVRKVVRADG